MFKALLDGGKACSACKHPVACTSKWSSARAYTHAHWCARTHTHAHWCGRAQSPRTRRAHNQRTCFAHALRPDKAQPKLPHMRRVLDERPIRGECQVQKSLLPRLQGGLQDVAQPAPRARHSALNTAAHHTPHGLRTWVGVRGCCASSHRACAFQRAPQQGLPLPPPCPPQRAAQQGLPLLFALQPVAL